MRKDGFTLIEALVTIVIFGVLAVVAIPRFSLWVPDMRLRGTVRDLKSDMELAKLKAIRENAFVALTFNTGTNSYTVFVDNGGTTGTAGDWIPNGDEEVLGTVAILSDVTMYEATFSGIGAQCRFNSRGLPNPYSGTQSANRVRMRNINNKYRGIELSPLGRIQIRESTDGGATWTDAD